MKFAHLADRAHRVERDVAVIGRSNPALLDLAEQVGFLADVVADLCDNLAPTEPTVLRRGCWLHDAPSLWFLLVEQIDFSEEWWAVRFDRYGCAAPSLRNIHVADYQRVEAPDWWVA